MPRISTIAREQLPGIARRSRAALLGLRAAVRRPQQVNVEATNRCQLRCATCPVGRGLQRPAGDMARATFEQLLDQLRWPIARLNWIMGGEPLLHHQLFDLVALASARGIRSKIDTNGMLLADATADLFASRTYLVNVVLESMDAERAASLRTGYQLPRVLDGLTRLCRERRRRGATWPRISINCLVGRHNEEQLDEVIAAARALGVDFINFKSINFNIGSLLDRAHMADLIARHEPRATEFRRHRPAAADAGPAHCRYVTHDLTVLHSGDVVPCCLDFEGRHVLGNVERDDLLTLWRGARMRALRAAVLGGDGLDICRVCTPPAGTRKLLLH